MLVLEWLLPWLKAAVGAVVIPSCSVEELPPLAGRAGAELLDPTLVEPHLPGAAEGRQRSLLAWVWNQTVGPGWLCRWVWVAED